MANTYKMPDGTIEHQFESDEEMITYLSEKYMGMEATNLLKDILQTSKNQIDNLTDEADNYSESIESYRTLLFDVYSKLEELKYDLQHTKKSDIFLKLSYIIDKINSEV